MKVCLWNTLTYCPTRRNASRVLSQYFPVLVHIDLHAVHCSVCVECVHTRMRGNPFVDARDNVLGAVFLLVEILVEIIIKSGELERLRKLCGTNSSNLMILFFNFCIISHFV